MHFDAEKVRQGFIAQADKIVCPRCVHTISAGQTLCAAASGGDGTVETAPPYDIFCPHCTLTIDVRVRLGRCDGGAMADPNCWTSDSESLIEELHKDLTEVMVLRAEVVRLRNEMNGFRNMSLGYDTAYARTEIGKRIDEVLSVGAPMPSLSREYSCPCCTAEFVTSLDGEKGTCIVCRGKARVYIVPLVDRP